MIKVMSVFGTRPEAIKMCPLVMELQKNENINSVVCLTGQHREMLQQVMDIFKIQADYNLDIMRSEQTLTTITCDILQKIEEVIIKEKPDLILVHGDTTTSFVTALAAFYQQVKVGHVEAGLRTYDKYSPFPEEMNRTLTGKLADIHFAPTLNNKINLEKEGIYNNIIVTGNTVIDAFKTTVKENYQFKNPIIRELEFDNHRVVLVTAHRRENLGKPLYQICKSILNLVEKFDDIEVVYPVHMNPAVRKVTDEVLKGLDRVHLIEPLDVEDMHNLMARSYIVMTDSGGLQEEAPSCGVPVLVMRTETERPEAVEAGTVKVVGVESLNIEKEAALLLSDETEHEKMTKAINPYGDGHASERIVKAIEDFFSNGQ